MLPRDVYVQPQADDPVLEPELVLRMVRRHVPRTEAVSHVEESGGEARAYFVDEDVVLKVQRPQQLRARTSLAKEVAFLEALSGDAEVRVPRVLGYGHEGSDIEYIVMTRMPGVAAITITIEGAARTRLMRDLGRMLRRMHGLPQQPLVENALFPGMRTQAEFRRRFLEGLDEAVAAIEREPAMWTLAMPAGDVAERARRLLPETVELVALHSNPGPEHVFVDPRTLELSGIIDFGDAFISHPGLDWRWPEYADRLAILDGYGDERALSEEFMAAWSAVLLLSDLVAAAGRPARREAALWGLAQIVSAE